MYKFIRAPQMYRLMLSDKTTEEIKQLRLLAMIKQALMIRRIKTRTPVNMVELFLRKEMGLSKYSDLVVELGTRICNNSTHKALKNAKVNLPEFKRPAYDINANIITLPKGTKIDLNTGIVQSGVETYFKCYMLDPEQCKIIKNIFIERLVRDEQKLRDSKKRKKKAEEAKELLDAAKQQIAQNQIEVASNTLENTK